jgi:alkanesulfonate monooxygenase SsuD/methylene tetrahydromethanopterin reductase-like flavin-dependent oxidoreductase (luciferase family)
MDIERLQGWDLVANVPPAAAGTRQRRVQFSADRWVGSVQAGPFSTLATGERVASGFLDLMGVLSAAAVLTERVRIQSLISLAPLHEPVLLAKQAATVDVLSGGRFTLGVGVGMREYDYQLAGKHDTFNRRVAALDDRVQVMKKVWTGNHELPANAPGIGPVPVQVGGPPVFSSSLGPKSMLRAAQWADGLAGFDMLPNLAKIEKGFDDFRDAWAGAGRNGFPTLQTSFWFGLTNDAPTRVKAFAKDYLAVFGVEYAAKMSERCWATSPTALKEILSALEQMGCDEVILTPTSDSLDELAAAEDFVTGLK